MQEFAFIWVDWSSCMSVWESVCVSVWLSVCLSVWQSTGNMVVTQWWCWEELQSALTSSPSLSLSLLFTLKLSHLASPSLSHSLSLLPITSFPHSLLRDDTQDKIYFKNQTFKHWIFPTLLYSDHIVHIHTICINVYVLIYYIQNADLQREVFLDDSEEMEKNNFL